MFCHKMSHSARAAGLDTSNYNVYQHKHWLYGVKHMTNMIIVTIFAVLRRIQCYFIPGIDVPGPITPGNITPPPS